MTKWGDFTSYTTVQRVDSVGVSACVREKSMRVASKYDTTGFLTTGDGERNYENAGRLALSVFHPPS